MPYKDPEKEKEYHRNYSRSWALRAREDPEYRQRCYDQNKKWREKNRLQTLIKSTQQSAKKRGIEHTITVEDLTQPEFCPLTGIKIDWSVSGHHMANPSVDRIDPNKGYVPGNVEVVSSLGNSMKNKATPEQLLHFAKEILNRYGTGD